MMNPTWSADNSRYTSVALQRVAAILEDPQSDAVASYERELEALIRDMSGLPALPTLESALGLSPFESDVLMLCAGVELDERVRVALEHVADLAAADGGVPSPTFGLALARLPAPHWSALTPAAPLRRWGLIELAAGSGVTEAALRISERVLHYLAGVHYLDDAANLRRLAGAPDATVTHARIAHDAAAVIAAADADAAAVVQLVVRRAAVGESIAAAAASELGLTAAIADPHDVGSSTFDVRAAARLIERESVLGGLLTVVDGADAASAARLADEIAGPVVVITATPLRLRRADVCLTVPETTPEERSALWNVALGADAAALSAETSRASDLFDLDPSAVHATAAEFGAVVDRGRDDANGEFWSLVRRRARPRLDGLAQRVTRRASWGDIVLPQQQLLTLREITAQARWRAVVQREWGLGVDEGESEGISALFSGPSGTGKTLAASVIANDLGLDLYRVDLSQVVSKYIGETEKNLGQIFDEVEGSGSVLLFDEADALFGRRSEVKDSHDRYANLEVSFLLQRMEAYRGLAILTTNQRAALDPAFLRRLRFAVPFPVPDLASRAEIWRRVYPDTVPQRKLDPERLAQLAVPGGNIRTIAVNAAFAAAADGSRVDMAHLLRAAQSEFVKLERALPEAQVRGWI